MGFEVWLASITLNQPGNGSLALKLHDAHTQAGSALVQMVGGAYAWHVEPRSFEDFGFHSLHVEAPDEC